MLESMLPELIDWLAAKGKRLKIRYLGITELESLMKRDSSPNQCFFPDCGRKPEFVTTVLPRFGSLPFLEYILVKSGMGVAGSEPLQYTCGGHLKDGRAIAEYHRIRKGVNNLVGYQRC